MVKWKESGLIILAGLIVGAAAIVLVLLGNPANMGFCIACFLRDIAGGVKLHTAPIVQYVRPEIAGLVLGALIMALAGKEFSVRGGSSPMARFVLGFCVMVGALMRAGFSLKKSTPQPMVEGFLMPAVAVGLLVLLVGAPTLLAFSESGPGSMHAPILAALVAGLVVGALAQKTRLCMVGGIRDALLFRDFHLLSGFVAIFVAVLVGNLILGSFHPGFAGQPVAHTDGVWNLLGMVLVGVGSVLLGGCPLRQLILSGSGNSDSSMAVLGMVVGAAFCHNFGLASSTDGPTAAGKVAVILGLVVVCAIGGLNLNKQK